jgi:serine protease Do
MTHANLKRGVLAASLAVLTGAAVHLWSPGMPQANAAAPVVQAPAVPATANVAAYPDFASIVRAYGPAVVNIAVTGKATARNADDEDGSDSLPEFFRRFGPGFPRLPQGQAPRLQRGQGSGFIVSADGTILTNAHVVDGATEVTVKLTDRREFKAKVVGSDRRSDIAVLKIDARNLPTVRLGNPADVSVGEWVLAIGSPFGFENTATSGIVSAKSRSLSGDSYVPFLQTDVAVNPGNSGGPLFNLKGEVIGINSQIYSASGGYQGISFAIPIDVASKVKDQLVATGKVTRGRIGVVVQEVTQDLADSFGLKKPQGALVSAVEKGGPAEKAGIEPGDVIIAFDGKTIDRSADLPVLVNDVRPGQRTRLEVVRKGAGKSLDVTVGEFKEPKTAASERDGASQGKLGLAVRPLDADEAREAGVKGGVVVEAVSGPAARAGLMQGDVILSVNGAPVKGVEDLRAAAAKAGKSVAVLVQRDNAKIFVPINLG